MAGEVHSLPYPAAQATLEEMFGEPVARLFGPPYGTGANREMEPFAPGDRLMHTYRELHDATLRLAGSLVEGGLRPGEVITVQLPNGWRPVAVDLAAAALGAVVLPYPVGRGRRDALALLRHSRAAVAVVTEEAGDHRLSSRASQRR